MCVVFIGAGSQAEYGRFKGKLNTQVPTFPENGYEMAKLCTGQMTRKRCEQKGLKHIWTRILSVYGPYDGSQTMVMSIIGKIMGLVYLILKLIYWDRFAAGTAPMLIGIFFLGAIQLFFLGFMGEYILSMNQRIMNRPLVIEEERINFEDAHREKQNV